MYRTLCNPMDHSMAGLPVNHQLPEFTQNHVHWVGDTIQPSHPLSSLSPPAFNLSQHQGLFKKSFLHIRWAKYWSFSFSISPSNEYSGLISFRMDWLDLLAFQGTLEESSPTPQFKSINSLMLSFIYIQLSHPHMITGKIIVLNKWTFVCKVMSLLFNKLCQFSRSVMSDSLQPHESQHTRPPCPSPTPGVHSNSRPLSQWCHPTISSSVIPFSSCPQSFPASGSFQMSQLFTALHIRWPKYWSLSFNFPMNIQGWFCLGLTGLIALQSKGLSRVFSNTTVQKHQFFGAQLSLWSNSHIHTWLLEKPWPWLDGPLSTKYVSTF